MRLYPLFPCCRGTIALAVLLAGWAASPVTGETVRLSEYPWAAELPWLRDFPYERVEVSAQNQTTVAYSMEMKIRHVESLRDSPWTAPTASADGDWVIGMSAGWDGEPGLDPQPVFGYTITEPGARGDSKLRVVLVGSNHAREHPACWTFHGMIDFLVSDDPRAASLRQRAVFFVYPAVNPDGKGHLLSPEHEALMTVNGNPELRAAGETNHNRLWDTSGISTTIDLVTAALRRDTGGRVDYLLDIHGIPQSTFFYSSAASMRAPYARVLKGRNPEMRFLLGGDPSGMLRVWAENEDGLGAAYSFTPEVENGSKEHLLRTGKEFALGFYDLVNDRIPAPPGADRPRPAPERPPFPVAAWLFEGDAKAIAPGMPTGDVRGGSWSEETRFDSPVNRSLEFDGQSTHVDFGDLGERAFRDNWTISLWAKGVAEPGALAYLAGQFNPSGNRRSWALTHVNRRGELQVTVSTDGTASSRSSKRLRSNLQPFGRVLGPEWQHIAVTFEGGGEGRLRVYINGLELLKGDGLLVLDDGGVPVPFASGEPFVLGSRAGESGFFEGKIDEIAIWNVALPPGAIHWLAVNGARGLLNR